MPKQKRGKKAPAPAPYDVAKQKAAQRKAAAKVSKPNTLPIIAATPRSFHIGGDLQPKRDLTRFVRWPRYVKLQRQKRVLMQRLKVPVAINQFNYPVEKNVATRAFELFGKYAPETATARKNRLRAAAEKKAKGEKVVASRPPFVVKFGLNHITGLVEQRKAQLVLIAHDVDPIELVVWLPTLCRKMGVPYAVVKNKARLGQLVHQKSATAVALVGVNKGDKAELGQLINAIQSYHSGIGDAYNRAGGKKLGYKSLAKVAKKQRVLNAEEKAKQSL